MNSRHLDNTEAKNISKTFKFKLFPLSGFSSLTSCQCYGIDLYLRYKLNLTNEEYEILKKFNLLEGFTIYKNNDNISLFGNIDRLNKVKNKTLSTNMNNFIEKINENKTVTWNSIVFYAKGIYPLDLIGLVYTLRKSIRLSIETDKMIISLMPEHYSGFTDHKQHIKVLLIRAREVQAFNKIEPELLFDYKTAGLRKKDQFCQVAYALFAFLVYTNLIETLDEVTFLTKMHVNLEQLKYLISKYLKGRRKIKVGTYDLEFRETKLYQQNYFNEDGAACDLNVKHFDIKGNMLN